MNYYFVFLLFADGKSEVVRFERREEAFLLFNASQGVVSFSCLIEPSAAGCNQVMW